MTRDHLDRPEKDAVFPRRTERLGADIKNSEEVLEADQVRRQDDVRTEERQADAAASQEEAARFLAENARRLDQSSEALAGAQDQVAENRERLDDLREDVESLRADTEDLTRDSTRDD
ncbi:MAG: hypothetical protein KY464_07660 [Gemmatimonadetes bacterium]|nr:hypothetical protein [Gemmatimonadota bacterium]